MVGIARATIATAHRIRGKLIVAMIVLAPDRQTAKIIDMARRIAAVKTILHMGRLTVFQITDVDKISGGICDREAFFSYADNPIWIP